MLSAILRLILLVSAGYLLFRPEAIRRRLLPPLSFTVINILIPLFMITRYGAGWDQAISTGAYWMLLFFLGGGATLFLQYLFAGFLTRRTSLFSTLAEENRADFLLLFAVHNAGYIALPVLETLAPGPVLVYMFSYILAFQLIFWSFAVSVIVSSTETSFRLRFRLNAPFIGILLGLLLAATGVYQSLPEVITSPAERISRFAMDGILLVLGGILAGLPHVRFKRYREFYPFLLIRQTLLPLTVLIFMLILRVLFEGPTLLAVGTIGIHDTWRWLQLVLVTQAAVPPATNLMIAVRHFGTDEQVNYTGTGIIISYLGAALSLPIFVFLAYYI